tara:strand:- start:3519 stop:4037 length:519 start_codon:yes stop_codon:yes gene_type:complete
MKLLLENWNKYLTEDQTFYHGTSENAGRSILKSGFSLSAAGARQKALHGKDIVEIGGIYLTSEKDRAKWYAGPDNTTPGMNQGGAVVETKISGKIMPEKEWWDIKRKISQEIGGGLYDDEMNKQKNEEAVRRAKEMGYVGFQENTDPNEIIVFDPENIKVMGGFLVGKGEKL